MMSNAVAIAPVTAAFTRERVVYVAPLGAGSDVALTAGGLDGSETVTILYPDGDHDAIAGVLTADDPGKAFFAGIDYYATKGVTTAAVGVRAHWPDSVRVNGNAGA